MHKVRDDVSVVLVSRKEVGRRRISIGVYIDMIIPGYLFLKYKKHKKVTNLNR